MTRGTLMLIGRETAQSDQTIETHAERLRERDLVDTVLVERYVDDFDGSDPPRDDGDLDGPVYVMPMVTARTNKTDHVVPSIAASIATDAILCESIGWSPVVTEIVADRASEHVQPASDASLLLVGLGSSSLPHQQRVLTHHETRLRDRTAYGEVTSAYLLQDPVVECARYNVSNDRVVAVPVFVAPSEATREEIPGKLGLERGGIEYADPLGTHPRLTDAIHAEVRRQQILETNAPSSGSATVTGLLDGPGRAMATDGGGSSH